MIQLYNSRTRAKEALQPLDPANVRMYVCGPTVYDRAHIGNARPVVVFDVLYRLLRHVYGAGHVTYVRNFTDVDDKIIARAQETLRPGETLEAACRRITDETIGWYHADMDALGALRPTHEPRCTKYIPQMVEMTRALVDKGCAYVAEGHVLFSVESWPRYGELSGRSVDDMIAGARVEVAPYKRSPMDFVLWKPSTPEQPGWPSPWGRGRPGWHIECSAMAKALLGEVFDIHGGGIDLQFPHHENELAQSCCVHDRDAMAQVWMHNGFVEVDGEKMAKSLGNFFTVKDLRGAVIGSDRLILRAEWRSSHRPPGRPLSSRVVRMCLLMTHYRQPLDWTFARVKEADRLYSRFRFALREAQINYGTYRSELPEEFIQILSDDLNTPEAIQFLSYLASSKHRDQRDGARLLAAMEFLGLIEDTSVRRIALQRAVSAFAAAVEQFEELGINPDSVFEEIMSRTNRDYRSTAIHVAHKLDFMNRRLQNPEGNKDQLDLDLALPEVKSSEKMSVFRRVSPDQLKRMLRMRDEAKRNKNYAKADMIRDELSRFGIDIIDTKEGPRWRPAK